MTWQEQFRALKPDWDSYGGQPIDERAIAAMESMLPNLGMPLWVVPTTEGGVAAESFTQGNYEYCELDVDETGTEWQLFFGPLGDRRKPGDESDYCGIDMTAEQTIAAINAYGVQFSPPRRPQRFAQQWVPA